MGLFGKKKEEEKKACCCGENSGAECCEGKEAKCCCQGKLFVKVLGSGCKNCHKLYENVKAAVAELGVDVDVKYITDLEKIMDYGVMTMPAVVVNEQVVSMGKVLSVKEIIGLLS
ncbi:MAG: thioredoxin family protein [Bulleidia sp.]